MKISAIVAVATNGVIGVDNQIPWFLPNDLKYFKNKTIHHHLLMGRKCWESLGKPLHNRVHLVVSRNPFYLAQGIHVVHSCNEGIEAARQASEEDLFVIGGAEIYKQTMDKWDTLYYTEVQTEAKGDVFFPEINWDEWLLVDSIPHEKDDRHPFDYTFKTFERKQ